MRFEKLPDLIIRTIFGLLCEEYICSKSDIQCNLSKWTERLALLSVSRAWRNIALPLVYKQSFISCIAENANQGIDSNIVVKTSLDIIPSDKRSMCQPMYLLLHIRYGEHPMLIINALLEQIRKRSALLDSVTHLDISIDLQNGNSLDPHPGLVGDIAQAVSLGNEFAQLVPGITYYEWPFVTNDDVLLAFIRAATKHYASNLSRISCELTVLSDVEHFSDKLRHLDIRCYSNDFSHFPLVQSAQLKMLRLIGIEKEFTWSSFQGDKGPNVLDFSSLKHLSLGVPFVTEEETQDNSPDTIWYGPADLFEYTVLAPQLVKFRTQLCPFSLSCLSSITGVDILPEVEILTMAKVVLKITNLKLNDVIKRKFSGYAKESVHNMLYMNWIDFANDIFCIPDFAENTRIDLNSIGSSFDASTINWPYLNCLIIRERIDIEYMLMLIKQLPNLTELKVFNLKLILTDDGHLSIPEIYESSDDELQPLDVNIKRITLMAGPLLLPATLQADTTEYLCKRLPSLDIVEY